MFGRSQGSGVSAPIALVREPFNLVVDLAGEPVGPRWARGAATLALLCGAALTLAPGLSLFPSAQAHAVLPGQRFQLNPMLTAGGAQEPPAPKEDLPTGPDAAEPVIAS